MIILNAIFERKFLSPSKSRTIRSCSGHCLEKYRGMGDINIEKKILIFPCSGNENTRYWRFHATVTQWRIDDWPCDCAGRELG